MVFTHAAAQQGVIPNEVCAHYQRLVSCLKSQSRATCIIFAPGRRPQPWSALSVARSRRRWRLGPTPTWSLSPMAPTAPASQRWAACRCAVLLPSKHVELCHAAELCVLLCTLSQLAAHLQPLQPVRKGCLPGVFRRKSLPEPCLWRRWCRRTGRPMRRWTPAGQGTRTLRACCGPTSAAWASPPWAAPAPASPARLVLVCGFTVNVLKRSVVLGASPGFHSCRQGYAMVVAAWAATQADAQFRPAHSVWGCPSCQCQVSTWMIACAGHLEAGRDVERAGCSKAGPGAPCCRGFARTQQPEQR